MNSVDIVPCRHVEETIQEIDRLQKDGHTVVVMETTALSKKYTKVNYPKKIALVVGNEVTGVHPSGNSLFIIIRLFL